MKNKYSFESRFNKDDFVYYCNFHHGVVLDSLKLYKVKVGAIYFEVSKKCPEGACQYVTILNDGTELTLKENEIFGSLPEFQKHLISVIEAQDV